MPNFPFVSVTRRGPRLPGHSPSHGLLFLYTLYILTLTPFFFLSQFPKSFNCALWNSWYIISLAKYPISSIVLLLTLFAFPAQMESLLSSTSALAHPFKWWLFFPAKSHMSRPWWEVDFLVPHYHFWIILSPLPKISTLTLMSPDYVNYHPLLVLTIHKTPRTSPLIP